MSHMNSETIFTNIYEKNSWKGEESRSGPSSGMERTKTLRSAIPTIVKKYDIKKFLDIPCGDFYWMKSVPWNIEYVGGDIVVGAVEANKKQFSTENISFIQIDLVNDPLPTGDLLFCRDCLFHLSYGDIAKVFENVLLSNSKYVMITSHITQTNFKNKDIKTGQWRYFDLTKSPFNLPATSCVESVIDGGGDRYMMLWKVSDIEEHLKQAVQTLRLRN